MTTTKPLKNTNNRLRSYLSIAFVLLAGATRVPPLFIEQMIPVVLRSLVRRASALDFRTLVNP
jgi:hypothetical protein